MTVTELIERLMRGPNFNHVQDNRVVIPITKHYPAIGGKPHVEVASVNVGFDWDNGKVFLYPEHSLTLLDETTEAAFKKYREELDKLAWENLNLKAENKKLKKKLDSLIK